ncbi:MAG: hypothetical protein K8F91_07000 [Candidatus Obscuribacterales bacterium]|nr:hypothetical protein [Candidatus Obscuribacterales bacterium]
MANKDRWSKEQSNASSSYRTLPMWMLQIEKKGRAATATTLKKESSTAVENKEEDQQRSAAGANQDK